MRLEEDWDACGVSSFHFPIRALALSYQTVEEVATEEDSYVHLYPPLVLTRISHVLEVR